MLEWEGRIQKEGGRGSEKETKRRREGGRKEGMETMGGREGKIREREGGREQRGRDSPLESLLLPNIDHLYPHTILFPAQDVVNRQARDGVVSFTPPCYYHFRIKT